MQVLIGLIAWLRASIRDEDGQTLVEYGLILALVSIVTVVILMGLGQGIVAVFTSVSGAF
jgi:Flp pilus assembly pilin Flp